jgi:hypothetical protein
MDIFDKNEPDFLSNLTGPERKHFMEVCYYKISTYPQLLLKDEISPLDVRVNSIRVLIKYFEGEEEYEKCAKLKKLMNKLEHGRKNSSKDQ